MELHQLRYFCAVAREGSFTRAAEHEGVSQPTLSQQIRKLEERLAVPLFERRGRSVRLTPAGERLLPDAQAMLQQMARARDAIDSLRSGVHGRLVIGCIPTVMPYLLAPRIGDFQKKYPEVDVRLIDHVTARLVEGLQGGNIDVAVLSLPAPSRDLVCAELFRDRLVVAMGPDHPLARASLVTPGDLRDARLLVLREGHCFRGEMLSVCRRARIDLGAVVETDQFASIFALAAAGFGVSVVPQMATAAAGGCRILPLAPPAARRIGYARAKRPFVPPAQTAFINWLKDETRPPARSSQPANSQPSTAQGPTSNSQSKR